MKRLEEDEETKRGIIILDSAKEKPIMGEVVATGRGKIKDDEYLILREDDIIGVIEK